MQPPHSIHDTSKPLQDYAALAYLLAREEVLNAGYTHEVEWQESVAGHSFSESDFLRELAWVVLSSGMRESVVRVRFPLVSSAFLEWRSASAILRTAEVCRTRALEAFRHAAKIDAILTAARLVVHTGIASLRKDLLEQGPAVLQVFPFIGPVTSQHLAKNLGFATAKADRHLVRIAAALGYSDPSSLCEEVAGATQHPVAVVDLVFWRYATLKPDYLSRLSSAEEWFSLAESP